MKTLIVIMTIVVLSGCVVMTAGKDNLNDDRKAGASVLLYDGCSNIHDCERAWKGELPPSEGWGK